RSRVWRAASGFRRIQGTYSTSAAALASVGSYVHPHRVSDLGEFQDASCGRSRRSHPPLRRRGRGPWTDSLWLGRSRDGTEHMYGSQSLTEKDGLKLES